MSAVALKVKDFVIDIPKVKEEVKKKKQVKQEQIETTYSVVLQNNIDFVINRKTSTTDKNLVFLISQGMFYIQNNKNRDVDMLSEQKLRSFFQQIYYEKWDKLDKVIWWKSTPEYLIKQMMKIVHDPIIQKMYQHGITDKHKIDSWKEAFNNNTKLFKYCYDKCQESTTNKDSFDNILKLASTIEQKINYNNATYFIDKFCESNVKMYLQEGYYRRSKEDHEMFINLINTYNLDFSRFIEYISFDLYSQGIAQFDNNILSEYSDYLRMQVSLYGKPKEKYPKNLKTEHDIIALKVTIYEKHKKDLMLLNVVEKYNGLEYKDKEYCIVLPQNSMDIVDEGVMQSHCVASYVDKVAINETLIVFMRTVLEPEKSLVTVEVKNGRIVQKSGFANRSVTEDEMKFLKKWAKEKELQFNL